MNQPSILLRAGWAFGNIGDIAIVPGMISLLEQHLPSAQLTVHLARAASEFRSYLGSRFPQVTWISDDNDAPTGPAMRQALRRSDLFLHASGPMIAYGHEPYGGPTKTTGWRGFDWGATIKPLLPLFLCRELGVPFGGFGIGINHLEPPSELLVKSILNDAAFFYTRETASLDYGRAAGICPPDMNFTPDCTFAFDMRDDQGAEQLLAEHRLESGRFLVVILRSSALAFTTPQREAHHCRQLRELMQHWIGRTGLPVLLCPETRQDIEPTGRLLFDPMPAAYKSKLRYHNRYWMPCLATSVYERAHSMIAVDHHSAIMALAAGTPALHPRDPMAGRKGQIFPDLGLGDWLFDINRTQKADIQPALDDLIDRPEAARARVAQAMALVNRLHQDAMGDVARTLGINPQPSSIRISGSGKTPASPAAERKSEKLRTETVTPR